LIKDVHDLEKRSEEGHTIFESEFKKLEFFEITRGTKFEVLFIILGLKR